MSYVIYNINTTVLFSDNGKDSWKCKGAATRAFNAAVKAGRIDGEDKAEYAIADRDFISNIEKYETIEFTNPHSGEKCTTTQRVNTPWCCDPRSELYWSM